ncbi:hypothetical protein AB6A40_004669 [Gnathostoma spinigerum]|uniref:Uncharacterized protein n=1 Tax=Gnathostoma spinigerum TaxID=75299 RepID=A0ABD6ED72_9BILA
MVRATSLLGVGLICTLLVGLLGLYHKTHPAVPLTPEYQEEYQQDIAKHIRSNIISDNIKKNLRYFTKEPHVAGTAANERVAMRIADVWKSSGLQDVHFVEYDVLLSYPDYEQPNTMQIVDSAGKSVYTSKGVSPIIIPDEQSDPGAGIQWVAYSGDGVAEGDVVYCHYGRREDFELLRQRQINLKGKIALLRYGRGFRGEKVWMAEELGAIGAVLFSDPDEVARDGTSNDHVYPNTEWMPNSGVQRGSIMHGKGDPLTPLYPSKKDLYRMKTVEEVKKDRTIPSIPVLPLSYSDAYHLISRLIGPAEPSWQGGFNISYHLGPGLVGGHKVRITVHSSLERRRIRNLIGYIYGTEDKDRYVIVGNHYDAWVYGAIDPNSGTAIMAEMARAIAQTIKETSWRPSRTIMFCNWDGEEHGVIGSTEFTEEFAAILNKRAVVYFNIDNIHSNQSLSVNTVPTLYQVITDTSKEVPNPMESERQKGRLTVYDTWIKTFPNEISFRPDAPRLRVPGAGSDHTSFLNYLGIPVADISYKNATTYDTYPLYHTLYETPFVSEHIFDNNDFAVHRAVGQYWASLIVKFTDSPILPMNVTDFANALVTIYVPDLKTAIETLRFWHEIISDARQQLSYLLRNCREFLHRAHEFNKLIERSVFRFLVNQLEPQQASLINDRIMLVDRCFINPRGLPSDPSQRHVLYSINHDDSYSANVMYPVYEKINRFKEAHSDAERKVFARQIAEQISIVQYSVQCATKAIAETI